MAESDKESGLNGYQQAALGVDIATDALALTKAGKVLGPAGQVVASTVGETAGYYSKIEGYESALHRPLDELSAGFNVSGYDPRAESMEKAGTNFKIGLGKGVALAAIGAACLFLGPPGWIGVIIGIPACLLGSVIYDKFVGRSNAQDPLKIAGHLRSKRDTGAEVTPEEMFALMVDTLPPTSELRKNVEQRLTTITGDHKLHHLLGDPASAASLSLLIHDPQVMAGLCQHYGVAYDPQFVQRSTKLYSEGQIATRGLLYPESLDVKMVVENDQMLSAPTFPVQPNLMAMHKAPAGSSRTA